MNYRGQVAVAALLTLSSLAVAGEPIKDFSLPSARDNSLIRLSDHAGKVILIHWWRSG